MAVYDEDKPMRSEMYLECRSCGGTYRSVLFDGVPDEPDHTPYCNAYCAAQQGGHDEHVEPEGTK